MVTKKQIKSLGFTTTNGNEYCDAPNWEYMFNIATQELYSINDGYGEPDLICRCRDLEHLKEVIELTNY